MKLRNEQVWVSNKSDDGCCISVSFKDCPYFFHAECGFREGYILFCQPFSQLNKQQIKEETEGFRFTKN